MGAAFCGVRFGAYVVVRQADAVGDVAGVGVDVSAGYFAINVAQQVVMCGLTSMMLILTAVITVDAARRWVKLLRCACLNR